MKAGTTWLHNQLSNHPEISFTPEKEIHYFSAVSGGWNLLSHEARIRKFFLNIEGKDFNRFKETINGICWYADYAESPCINDSWYQDLFKNVSGAYCADFCNLNSRLDDSGWLRVRQNVSHKLKVTYCLRDPFKRAWSHYKFHMGWIQNRQGILSDGFNEFKNLLNTDWFKEIARYDLVINRLEKNLTRDEFKIFYFEDFHSRPQSTLDQLCDFLGIAKINTASISDRKTNVSRDVAIPEDWGDFLWDYLTPVYVALDEKGLLHTNWIRRSQ